MKKILSLLCAGIFLFLFVGCDCSTTSHNKEIPEYSADKGEFFIGAYCEPYVFEQSVYDDIAACGLTHIYIDPWFNGTIPGKEENICKALELCEGAGIKALIMPNNSHEMVLYDKPYVPTSEYLVDYSQYPAFAGFYAFDEPYSSQFQWIVDDYNEWVKKYPDYMYLINMMKNDNALTTDEYFTLYGEKVLNNLNKQSKIFSIDHYPLNYINRGNGSGRYFVNETYINAMEDASYYAKEYGCEFYAYIQTIGSMDGSLRRPRTIDEVRWQVAVPMAFGARGIECFTYTTMAFDGWYPSIITGGGTKTDLYDLCQEVFTELHSWENVYLSFEYQGTMAYDSVAKSENADDVAKLRFAMKNHERIKTYSAQRDLLVGVFKDENNYDGFLFTTYNDPYYRKYNKIKVEFNDTAKLLVYKNGVKDIIDVVNGVFEYELCASDILFVIPISKQGV